MDLGSALLRFVLGGVVVSVFAALGGCFNPKTFAGLFGSAPTVALASLGLAFREHAAAHVQELGVSMALGAVALLVYSLVCSVVVKRHGLPVALGAALSWGSWGLVAGGLFWGLRS